MFIFIVLFAKVWEKKCKIWINQKITKIFFPQLNLTQLKYDPSNDQECIRDICNPERLKKIIVDELVGGAISITAEKFRLESKQLECRQQHQQWWHRFYRLQFATEAKKWYKLEKQKSYTYPVNKKNQSINSI